MTSLLDAAGMGLIVAAGVTLFGVGVGLALAGVGMLLVSWSLTRSKR
jgi:hypothetical protein